MFASWAQSLGRGRVLARDHIRHRRRPGSSAATSSIACSRDGHDVVGYDNFSTGQRALPRRGARDRARFTLVEGDMLDLAALTARHARAATSSSISPPTPTSASAPSIRAGTSSRTRSPRSTCSRRCAPTASAASRSRRPARSTASRTCFPTPEDAPFPVQTSLYGASKLAGEGLIAGLLRGLRLPGLHLPLRLDPRRALHPRPRLRFLPAACATNPSELRVLGNGHQRKSYLYVQDCIDAMLARDREGARTR